MNIVVAIKQVPNTNDVKIDPSTGTLIREGVPSIVNPEDFHAVELALQIKETLGTGKVTLISMGPPQAEIALREALAMGADEAILLSDKVFAGADTLATACALSYAIKKHGNFDIVLCGRQAIDGDTAQVGPQLAEFLGIPQVTYVRNMKWDQNKFIIERAVDNGYQILEVEPPFLATCLKELNHPRIPTIFGCLAAFREKPFFIWTNEDIKAPIDSIGLKGSPTQVKKTFTPPPKGQGVILTGDPKSTVKRLLEILREQNVGGIS